MNLHVYGDSFSTPNRPNSGVDRTWNEIVSDALGVENVNYAASGVSNDWIYYQVIESAPKWEDGDYVIIQLTAPSRDWVIEDQPMLSNLLNCKLTDTSNLLGKNIIKAIDYYIKYLYNESKYVVQYNMLFNALNFIALNQPNKNIRIIPGFKPLPGFDATLVDICYKEFDSAETQKLVYNKTGQDPRINHLSKNNHKILGQKVLDFFQKGITPSFVTGYDEKIITQDNYKTLDF